MHKKYGLILISLKSVLRGINCQPQEQTVNPQCMILIHGKTYSFSSVVLSICYSSIFAHSPL